MKPKKNLSKEFFRQKLTNQFYNAIPFFFKKKNNSEKAAIHEGCVKLKFLSLINSIYILCIHIEDVLNEWTKQIYRKKEYLDQNNLCKIVEGHEL